MIYLFLVIINTKISYSLCQTYMYKIRVKMILISLGIYIFVYCLSDM